MGKNRSGMEPVVAFNLSGVAARRCPAASYFSPEAKACTMTGLRQSSADPRFQSLRLLWAALSLGRSFRFGTSGMGAQNTGRPSTNGQ